MSNVNGKPWEADNNGYISEVSPDGKVTKVPVNSRIQTADEISNRI